MKPGRASKISPRLPYPVAPGAPGAGDCAAAAAAAAAGVANCLPPKMEDPTRTFVLPAAMARSKSPLIPMESSRGEDGRRGERVGSKDRGASAAVTASRADTSRSKKMEAVSSSLPGEREREGGKSDEERIVIMREESKRAEPMECTYKQDYASKSKCFLSSPMVINPCSSK